MIAQVEDEMNLNPMDVMQTGNVECMSKVQDGLDKTCAQKFRKWKAVYAIVLDTTVEAALQSRLTNLMQDLVAYKRLALVKQDARYVRWTTWEDAVDVDTMNTMNAKKVDNMFVSKKGDAEFKTDAELNMGSAPGMFKKVRRP